MEQDTINFNDLRLIVYDFDGVMTDNCVWLSENGIETVRVHRGDGMAVQMIKKMRIPQIIISTETNPVVSLRGDKLGIPVIQEVDDKLKTLKQYCKKNGIALKQVLYIGNDINDLDCMNAVGWSVAPADSHPCICQIAKRVLRARGGQGVVRELADLLLKNCE